MKTHRPDLDGLLSPTDRSAFFAEHWEQAPLVVQRRQPAYYESLLGGADLDGIVASACSLQPSSVELLRDGRIVECKRDERPADIYRAYRQGHSVRVKGVQRLWPPLWQLCRRLQQDFGFPVKANLYCTPANSRGTLQHYDCHDVFVIQIAGRKRWRISASIPPLPLEDVPRLAFERHDASVGLRGGTSKREPGPADQREHDEPTREVVLEAGDTLYVPRGTVHKVWAEDSPSAHVTVGIYVITWLDLVAVALGQVAREDVRFRRAVPIGATTGLIGDETLREIFQSLLREVSQHANLAAALDELAGRFVSGMQAFGDGALLEAGEPIALGPDVEIQWWPGVVFRLTTLNGSVGLASCDASVTAPEALGEPLRFIAGRPRFKIKELPGGLTPRSKVALVRQLIEKKMLCVCSEAV